MGVNLLLLAIVSTFSTPSPRQDQFSGTLRSAEIRIVRYAEHSVVINTFIIDRVGGPIEFIAPRLPGQLVIVDGAFGPDIELEAEHQVELRRLRAPAGAPGVAEFQIRYKLEGDLSAVPVFVPNAPSAPAESDVVVVAIGETEGIDGSESFPRLRRAADGSLTATVSNVPNVVNLQNESAGVSVTFVSQLAVVVMILLGSLYWGFRFRRRAPAPSPTDPPEAR